MEASIFLFGSFMLREQCEDIDLLIVYNIGFYEQVKNLKRAISLVLQKQFNLPIHFTTLTREEFECLEDTKTMQMHVVYSFYGAGGYAS